MTLVRLRAADLDDAEQVASLHADSWRRHYRGAYADSFLDGDVVVADRRSVWASRLAGPTNSATVLAEDDAGLAGFVHVVFDDDDRWGSLVDNLHITHDRQRTGIGGTPVDQRRAGRGRARGDPVDVPVGARAEQRRAGVLSVLRRRPR